MNLRELLTRDGNKRLPPVLPHANEPPVTVTIEPPTSYEYGTLDAIYNHIRIALLDQCRGNRTDETVKMYEDFRSTGRNTIHALSDVSQTRLTKRVAAVVKQTYGYKIEKDAQEYIGNLDQPYRATSMLLDVTDNFDWEMGDFADKGSCFWNPSYHLEARLSSLPKAGAYALRSYASDGKGNGRCWVIPVPWGYQNRSMTAPPMYVLTNNYGAMAGINRSAEPIGARAMVAWLNMHTETKWVFTRMNTYTYAQSYVNGDSWLIHPTEGYKKLPTEVRMQRTHFVLPEPTWVATIRNEKLCPVCRRHDKDLGIEATYEGRACKRCLQNNYCQPADLNGVWAMESSCRLAPDGKKYTVRYFNEHYFYCEIARKAVEKGDTVDVVDGYANTFPVSREAATAHTTLIGGTRYLTSVPRGVWRRVVRLQTEPSGYGKPPVFNRYQGTVTVYTLPPLIHKLVAIAT